MKTLNEQQTRYLRRLAHPLKPVVLMGGAGLTEAVLEEIRHALNDHELIKVKVVADDREQRQQIMQDICKQTQAQPVQLIGKVAVLWRRSQIEKKRRIALP